MSLKVYALNTNLVSESGLGQMAGRMLSPGVMGLLDLQVTQKDTGTNMSVDVAPGAVVLHNPAGHGHILYSTGVENVPLAPADPLNPRQSLIVAVLDVDFTNPLINDAEGGWSIIEVAGAAASSPIEPDSSQIQAAAGAGNLYAILALVDVPADASQITNAQITDRRTQAGLNVPLASNSVGRAQIVDGSVTNSKLSVDPDEIGGAWQDWGLTLTPSGTMTMSAIVVRRARYKQVGKTVFVQAAANFTLGGTLNSIINFSLPLPSKGAGQNSIQFFSGYIVEPNPNTQAIIYTDANNKNLGVLDKTTAFTSGANRGIRISGCYETD